MSCEYKANFEAGMDVEDEAVMDKIDDIRRNPAKYGYGGS
jgi:protein gp37